LDNEINTLEKRVVMDAREEMKRWIATIIQNATQEDSSQVKADIDLFLGASSQLAGTLSGRYETLAKRYRPNRPKPPKLPPAKPLQQDSGSQSSADTPQTQMDAQNAKNRPEGKSRIQQGVLKAQQRPKSQQQELLRQVYGPQNKAVAFLRAAKTLAS
jgi:hypothetical protein